MHWGSWLDVSSQPLIKLVYWAFVSFMVADQIMEENRAVTPKSLFSLGCKLKDFPDLPSLTSTNSGTFFQVFNDALSLAGCESLLLPVCNERMLTPPPAAQNLQEARAVHGKAAMEGLY